jgi:hypothetical protein
MAQDLSKRGKIGDVYRGGSYKKSKAKTAGLSSDEMKKATTLKGKKISASQMKKAGELKPISSTKWVEGKGVVGPGGKAFTGTVQLATGKTASYVKGRRIGVKAGAAKPKPTPASSGSTRKTSGSAPSKPAASSTQARTTKRPGAVRNVSIAGRATTSSSSTKSTRPRPKTRVEGGYSAYRPMARPKTKSQFTVSGKKRSDPVPIGDVFRRMFSGYGGR